METRKLKLGLLAAALAALLMVPFVLQRGNINQLRSENSQLAARVHDLTAELQNARTNAAQKGAQGQVGVASKDQLLELMRLRAEVTALRKLTNAAAGAIPAAIAASENSAAGATVGDAANSVQVGTNAPPWTYRGFARPEDTLSTWIWGMEQGRMDLVMNSATPEGQVQLQRTYQSATNSVEKLQSEAKKILEVRPSTTHPSTENEVYMTLVVQEPAQQMVAQPGGPAGAAVPAGTTYTQGAHRRETTVKLQRLGNDWRYAGAVEGKIGFEH